MNCTVITEENQGLLANGPTWESMDPLPVPPHFHSDKATPSPLTKVNKDLVLNCNSGNALKKFLKIRNRNISKQLSEYQVPLYRPFTKNILFHYVASWTLTKCTKKLSSKLNPNSNPLAVPTRFRLH